MIITSIHAENVLRYAHLTLDHVPEEGMIAISGENESGKSTIGETVCFALFGRTFSLDSAHIGKIIRWGESHCSVTVSFRQGSEHYLLSRFLDNDGNHSAKLVRSDSGQLIANGVMAVTNTLHDLLGYDFDGFINSFYLAQREITAPHPRSETVKIMAGISPLEWVMKEIDTEISQEEGEISTAEQRIAEIDAELTELSFDKTRLRTLRKQYTSESDLLTELQRQITGLEQANRRYKETLPLLRITQMARSTTKFARDLSLLSTMLIGGGWMLLTWLPDHFLAQWFTTYLASFLSQWVAQPQTQSEYLQWALFGTLGVFFSFLLFWIMDSILRRRIHRLESERITLAVTLRKIYHTATVYRSIETTETIEAGVVNIPGERTASLSEMECPADDEIHRIAQLIVDNTASVTQTEDIIQRTLTWLTTLAGHYGKMATGLDAAITREEGILRKVQHLEGICTKFHSTIDEHRRRIVVRSMAKELLQGACGRMAQRFNRDVRDLVGTTLPLFTGSRYQYLRIDNDLNVRIFSKEKHDFMDLDEVSSGTQRQTMLSLRLALAQQLLERTRGVPQFLFLDEPFAFFDESRTRQTLAVLPKLSGKLSQIWIIAQSFPEEAKSSFSRHIACLRDKQNQTNSH
ncbi:AAA_23 domain-containing protein [Gammaproteobacteria bacterium]